MFSAVATHSEFAPIPNTTFVVPLITSTGVKSFLFLLRTDGTVAGRITLPGFAISQFSGVYFQRYNEKLFLFVSSLTTTAYVFNLVYGTVSSLTIPVSPFFTTWTRISNNTLLQIDTANSRYHVLDMDTLTITTTTGYTAATDTTGRAGSQGLLSFYTRNSSGLSSFGGRVYWTASENPSTFASEVNTATLTGATLSPRSIALSGGPNYSRAVGRPYSNTTGLVSIFDTTQYTTLESSSSVTSWTLATAVIPSFAGLANWNQMGTGSNPSCLTTNGKLYKTYSKIVGSNYFFAIGVYDFSAATGTETPVGVLQINTVGSADSIPTSVNMVQVNDNGYVAISYLDRDTSLSTLKTVIVDGTSIVATNSVDVTSTFSTLVVFNPGYICTELGLYLSGSSY